MQRPRGSWGWAGAGEGSNLTELWEGGLSSGWRILYSETVTEGWGGSWRGQELQAERNWGLRKLASFWKGKS